MPPNASINFVAGAVRSCGCSTKFLAVASFSCSEADSGTFGSPCLLLDYAVALQLISDNSSVKQRGGLNPISDKLGRRDDLPG